MAVRMTHHANRRIRQRGRRESEVEFVYSHGTECQDGVLFTNKDRDRLVADARRRMQLASRLVGTFVAYDGEIIKTVYRANKEQQHRKLSEK